MTAAPPKSLPHCHVGAMSVVRAVVKRCSEVNRGNTGVSRVHVRAHALATIDSMDLQVTSVVVE